jgi:hypothetical protein
MSMDISDVLTLQETISVRKNFNYSKFFLTLRLFRYATLTADTLKILSYGT